MVDLLVSERRSVTIGGTQTMGSTANPVTMLIDGPSTAGLTYGSTGVTYYGLLCNRYGSFTQNSGKIVGLGALQHDRHDEERRLDRLRPHRRQQGARRGSSGHDGAGRRRPASRSAWYKTSPSRSPSHRSPTTGPRSPGSPTRSHGIPGAYHRLDGSFSVPAPRTRAPDGTYTVQYWAQDNIGNVEAAKTVVIRIDTTAPAVTSFAIAGGADWTKAARRDLDLDVADAGAGGIEMRFRDEGGTWSAGRPTPPPSWTLPTGDGSKTVYAQFKDALGNTTTEVSDSIGLDTTAPAVTSFAIAGGADWTKAAAVTLDLDVADAGAGGIEMRFRDEGGTWGAWQTYAASAAWTLPTGDGSKTVYAQFKDALGNTTTEVSDSIGLDTAKPDRHGGDRRRRRLDEGRGRDARPDRLRRRRCRHLRDAVQERERDLERRGRPTPPPSPGR